MDEEMEFDYLLVGSSCLVAISRLSVFKGNA